MAEQVTIVCPHCNFSKTISKNIIPENVVNVTCPACKQSFPLNRETLLSPTSLPPSEASQSYTDSGHDVVPEKRVQPAPQTLNFEFKGTAGEYFGIWIVNTLLKIVTAGIYSAWAKVRMRRFFYGSTSLQGQSFEYLADPIAIFKGWLIAACAFILYMIASRVNPILSIAVALTIFLAFPWLLVRSRMFNARNSSYRNIRFGFKPDYRQAYFVYAGLPILSILTLGIMFPYMLYRQKKFMIANSFFGATPFSFTATPKEFYIISIKVGLGFLGIVILFGGLVVVLAGGISSFLSPSGRVAAFTSVAFLPILAFPLIYFLFMVYGQTSISNLCWNGTQLRGNIFISKLRTGRMALLFITNALAIIFSFGLMMPWATVRMIRYRFDTLSVFSDNSIDSIMAAAANMEAISATGEEIGDLFDMPIDIGL